MRVENTTDIKMVRGDSEGILLRFNNYELTESDKIELTVRKTFKSPEVIRKMAQLMEDGTALVTIYPEDTADLDFGAYIYDVQVTFANGSVKTVVPPSTFFIGGEVTYGE